MINPTVPGVNNKKLIKTSLPQNLRFLKLIKPLHQGILSVYKDSQSKFDKIRQAFENK